MEKVTSADGTAIAYDRLGEGPAVVLVCGGSVDRMSNAPLAALLAQNHTVYNYDRRGRGDSGDAPEYASSRTWTRSSRLSADRPACTGPRPVRRSPCSPPRPVAR